MAQIPRTDRSIFCDIPWIQRNVASYLLELGFVKSSLHSVLILGGVISGLAVLRADAVQSYTLDPGTGPYEFLGTGSFQLTVGTPLGGYQATGVNGGGKTFGTWEAINFRAFGGTFSSLVISNLVGAAFEVSLPGIGGGEISPGSQADLEWDHFMAALNTATGISIRSVPTSVVPDGGPLLPWSAATLGGIVLLAYRRKAS